MSAQKPPEFIAVDLTTLRVGHLVDRPMYAYLQASDRYVLMVHPLHPLEESTLSKFKRFGFVYSDRAPLEQRYPDLKETAYNLRQLCEGTDQAAFEVNRAVRKYTRWMVDATLNANPESPEAQFPAVFCMHRMLSNPRAELLQHVLDLSVPMYERCIKVASVSALLALWLGYSDSKFLTQFIETVFCEEVGAFQDVLAGSVHGDAVYSRTGELITAKKIPGVSKLDQRFVQMLYFRSQSQITGDELAATVAYARSLCGIVQAIPGAEVLRVMRKLERALGLLETANERKPATAPAMARTSKVAA